LLSGCDQLETRPIASLAGTPEASEIAPVAFVASTYPLHHSVRIRSRIRFRKVG